MTPKREQYLKSITPCERAIRANIKRCKMCIRINKAELACEMFDVDIIKQELRKHKEKLMWLKRLLRGE